MDELKKCLRGGCLKKYTESQNTSSSCKYHPGKPLFHDLKKGWTCCNVIVYDWEEFEKIVPCSVGFYKFLKFLFLFYIVFNSNMILSN